MAKALSIEQIENEIFRLQKSEAVKLARLEEQRKAELLNYLMELRRLEKRGRQLQESGITLDDFEIDTEAFGDDGR